MKPLVLFSVQQKIIGICPRYKSFFRLSEARIYKKSTRFNDWLFDLKMKEERLERAEDRLADKEYSLREKARENGRKQANRIIKKIDPIFTPKGLQAKDSKLILNPHDFVVFNGINKNQSVNKVIILDNHKTRSIVTQSSIKKTVEKKHYEFITFNIQNDGSIERVK